MLFALVPSGRFIGSATAFVVSERSVSLQLLMASVSHEARQRADITDASGKFVIEWPIQIGAAELFRQQP